MGEWSEEERKANENLTAKIESYVLKDNKFWNDIQIAFEAKDDNDMLEIMKARLTITAIPEDK